jgi:hypothetical protein
LVGQEDAHAGSHGFDVHEVAPPPQITFFQEDAHGHSSAEIRREDTLHIKMVGDKEFIAKMIHMFKVHVTQPQHRGFIYEILFGHLFQLLMQK